MSSPLISETTYPPTIESHRVSGSVRHHARGVSRAGERNKAKSTASTGKHHGERCGSAYEVAVVEAVAATTTAG